MMLSDDYHWQRPGFRRRQAESRLSYWVVTALILSIAVHGILLIAFGTFEVPPVAKVTLTEPFSIKRSTFDATVLDDVPDTGATRPKDSESQGQTEEALSTAEEIAKFTEFDAEDVPADFIVNAEIKLTPTVEEVENLVLGGSGEDTPLEDPADGVMGNPDEELAQTLRGFDENPQPLDPDHPTIASGDLLGGFEETTADPTEAAAGGGGGDLIPDGYAGLDEVLGMKGEGDPGKPIWVPTDVLFEFNSAELRDEARLSLMKLGALIMQRKDSEFILEGHTDLIGDDSYNLALSVNRATAIRDWLLEALRLDPDRIKVEGRGKADPIVLEGTPEEQAPNRRVEVTIQPLGTADPLKVQ